jgi:hypothetical protein
VGAIRPSTPRQLQRLIDELADVGLDLGGGEPWHTLAVTELDYAMRPAVHERRVPSVGAIVEPTTAADEWEHATELDIERRPIGERSTDGARRYADGMSSWLVRRVDHRDEWLVFDRPAGSERDLVVLAEALGGVVIQRHPAGLVRVVGTFGVFRWNGREWQHQPLVSSWIDTVNACSLFGDRDVLQTLLEFAVHDLGARNIGAVLVYRPDRSLEASFDQRLALPPALRITHPADLAPLRHVLSQVDGAALFDDAGTLREIGVRLVPTSTAETEVEGLRGTRHTSARRYSFDDPTATVIAISEDGPVTVFRGGEILGASGE